MSTNITRTRHAVSLIELMVVLSACTVILTMSAALVHRVMHAQSKTRAFFDIERSALRLSNQFRRDVHQATAALAGADNLGDGVFLRLELPDNRSVDYYDQEGDVVRILAHDGDALSREEFPFPPG